jgi:SPP1 family predicted phage head-tail adaptor
MVRIGRMRHRITIQRRAITFNDLGEPVETWSDWKRIWASVEPLSGREYFSSAQAQAEVTHRIRMRRADGFTTTDRIVFNDRVFEVDSIQNIGERNKELVVMAVEQV